MLKRFLRQSKPANRSRIAPSPFAKLKLEQLEARDVPALWAVHLWSPGAGVPGDTAAIHSGSLSANAALPTNSNGDTLVEANSIQEAVGLAQQRHRGVAVLHSR